MRKILIYDSYGGFSLTPQVFEMWLQRSGHEYELYHNKRIKIGEYERIKINHTSEIEDEYADFIFFSKDEQLGQKGKPYSFYWEDYGSWNLYYNDYTIDRDDSILIELFLELCEKFNKDYEDYKIIEIPEDVDWIVCSSDTGHEWVEEVTRKWR
jgi:hypothetical protein